MPRKQRNQQGRRGRPNAGDLRMNVRSDYDAAEAFRTLQAAKAERERIAAQTDSGAKAGHIPQPIHPRFGEDEGGMGESGRFKGRGGTTPKRDQGRH